jgi:hypothetical protein
MLWAISLPELILLSVFLVIVILGSILSAEVTSHGLSRALGDP